MPDNARKQFQLYSHDKWNNEHDNRALRLTNASVIPIPARRIGVSPIFGLILVPTKGPMGVSCSIQSPPTTQTRQVTRAGLPTELKALVSNVRDASYPRSRLIISTPYDVPVPSERNPELIESTSRNSFGFVDFCLSFESSASMRGWARTCNLSSVVIEVVVNDKGSI
jgi:hypothetical protein